MGDEEKVEGQQQIEQVEGQQPPEGERAANDKGEQAPKDGKWIPKHRFDEVNQGYTKYKELGSPDDIRKAMGRLKELEALPQNRTTDKEKAEIRKELLNVFPELQVMTNMMEVQRQAYTEQGASANNEFLKEIGIEVNDSNNQYLQELLSGIIAADPKLLRRFYAMDQKVFSDAFAVAKKTFWPNVRRVIPGANVQGKKVVPKAPITQKPNEQSEKPKSQNGQLGRLEERDLLDKASEEAFAMLESSRQE
jgi:hypothetical protein